MEAKPGGSVKRPTDLHPAYRCTASSCQQVSYVMLGNLTFTHLFLARYVLPVSRWSVGFMAQPGGSLSYHGQMVSSVNEICDSYTMVSGRLRTGLADPSRCNTRR